MNSVDEGLRALVARGYLFHHLKDDEGCISRLVGSFGWGEFYDRIDITDEAAAVAVRAVMAGLAGTEEIVWKHEGDALSVINAMLALPNPGEPGAPRLLRRAPSDVWLPATRPHLIGGLS